MRNLRRLDGEPEQERAVGPRPDQARRQDVQLQHVRHPIQDEGLPPAPPAQGPPHGTRGLQNILMQGRELCLQVNIQRTIFRHSCLALILEFCSLKKAT